MELNIGINAQDRQDIASGLSKLLADSYSLYLKTHNYHWNVTGPMFNSLHTMFEAQYDELALAVDEVAERIRHLATRQQVILITHWPQLARLADEHFAIRKEVHDGVTYTFCESLAPAERTAELARMVGETASTDSGLMSGNAS